MNPATLFGSWASGISIGGFALWTGFAIFSLLILFVGLLYWGLIKSSDLAKSLTHAAVWVAITAFTTLILIFVSLW